MNGSHSARRLMLPLLLAAYGVWVLAHWEPVCVAPDAVGLCQQAEHFAESGLGPFRPESPAQLVGTHWVQTGDDTYRGRFPPGYPLVLGAAHRLVGPDLSLLLGPLFGAVAVCLLFGLARETGERSDAVSAFLAATLLATFPVQNRLVLHGDTHVPAVANLLAGTWLLLRWDRAPSRRRAFVAGLVWGLLPSFRYGESVMTLAAGAFMTVRGLRKGGGHGKSIWAGLAGAGIPLVLLGLYNAVAYGRPWRTGYAFTGEQTAFSASEVLDHSLFYLSSLAAQPIVVLYGALGVCSLGIMLLNREARRFGLFILGCILLSVLLYTSYYWGPQEFAALSLRFFLPAMALLAVATAWLLGQAQGRTRRTLRVCAVVVIVLGVVGSEAEMRHEGSALKRGNALVSGVRQAVPGGSVLITPRGLGDALSYGGRWHLVPQWLFPGDPERERIIVPWEVPPEIARQQAERPAPMQATRSASMRMHYRGLDGAALVAAVFTDIRRWQPSADLFWIGDPRVVMGVDSLLTDRRFRVLGEMVLSEGGREGPTGGEPSGLPPRIPIFILDPALGAVSGAGASPGR